VRSRRCRHAQGLSCAKTRIFSFVFHFICSLNVLLLSDSPNYWAAKWKCVQTKALISLDCALCRFQCMLTWCEKGSKLFTETCFLLQSRQSYTTGTESSALSKYWDDFCAKRFGDINYSGLIFITWRCDYHGFNGISVYCVMFDRSPPRAGLDFFARLMANIRLFYSRSFKTILRWGSKEFLKMSRWILGWIFKVSWSTWKTFASCVSL